MKSRSHSYTFPNRGCFSGGRPQTVRGQTLTLEIPKEILINYPTVRELKQTLYEDLVQKGHLSLRQGAALLGLTYEEFMIDFLGDRQISFINGEPDELEAEFQQEQLWLEEACGNLS
jgi:predicted HTH domain antitoxin